MDKIKSIVGINLIILIIYMLFINLTSTGGERDLGIMVLSLVFVGAHTGVNFLVAIIFFFKKEPNAKYYLLSALVVGIVGFSACWGSVMI